MNLGQFGFPQILAGQQTKLGNSIGSKSKYHNYITFQPVHVLHLLLLETLTLLPNSVIRLFLTVLFIRVGIFFRGLSCDGRFFPILKSYMIILYNPKSPWLHFFVRFCWIHSPSLQKSVQRPPKDPHAAHSPAPLGHGEVGQLWHQLTPTLKDPHVEQITMFDTFYVCSKYVPSHFKRMAWHAVFWPWNDWIQHQGTGDHMGV